MPNTAQVRPAWVWKLTWTISRVAVRRITTCWNISSGGAVNSVGVVEERDVDAALVDRVGVRDLVVAARQPAP